MGVLDEMFTKSPLRAFFLTCGPRCGPLRSYAKLHAYSEDIMRAKLAAIPLEGRSVEDVAAAVTSACKEEGVEVACRDSWKSNDAEPRVLMRRLKCIHGMQSLEEEQREKQTGDNTNNHQNLCRLYCNFSY